MATFDLVDEMVPRSMDDLRQNAIDTAGFFQEWVGVMIDVVVPGVVAVLALSLINPDIGKLTFGAWFLGTAIVALDNSNVDNIFDGGF